MTTYATGNPLGSTSPKDLKDNAENFDRFANGPAATYPDRFGTLRKSIQGINAGFDADQASRTHIFTTTQSEKQRQFDIAQAVRKAAFDAYILSSGYQDIGSYDDGPLHLTERNQIFLKGGELWKAASWLVLPYTTTGIWADESSGFVSVGDAALRQELAAPNGSAMTGFIQLSPDAVPRTSQEKLGDVMSVKDFGAVCDGVTDDTIAVQRAITAAGQAKKALYIPGICVITAEVYFRDSIMVYGDGAGAGYGAAGLTSYVQRSGFLVKGAGVRRVRTRVLHRATAAAPQDNPISTALNVQAEFVRFKDFCVFLDFDSSDPSPTNFGADWDVGVFLGCRVHFSMENVHVLGYWRQASAWLDVTRSAFTNEFSDPTGVPYSPGTVVNGADGCVFNKCYFRGGKWGVKVQGAKPAAGNASYGPVYYDELQGSTVPDSRGSFGFSDFNLLECSVYGPEHHSRRRLLDTAGNYLTDPGCGAMTIDGLGGASAAVLQGMRFVSTRFTSGEAYRVKLDGVNRPCFIACHIEVNAFSTSTTGAALTPSDFYGPITSTLRTQRLYIQNLGGYTLNYAYMANVEEVNNICPHATDVTTRFAGFVSSTRGIATVSTDLLLDAPTGQLIRQRVNSVTCASVSPDEMVFWGASRIRPVSDNVVSLGRSINRFSVLYAGTGTINTSDAREKGDIRALEVAELAAGSRLVREVGIYQWIASIQQKGDDQARLHVGMTVQKAIEILSDEGLDPFDYGLVCYDKWDDQYETFDEVTCGTGVAGEDGMELRAVVEPAQTKLIKAAGDLYGFREGELHALMLRSLAMELDAIGDRLAALEGREAP